MNLPKLRVDIDPVCVPIELFATLTQCDVS